jgi:putative DNA primase/helicase
LPWDYNPDAISELVIPLLESFLPKEETITLYELIAYCLYRAYPYQKLFMLYGRGLNGKSLFAKILETLLGIDNVSHTSMGEIQKSRFAASELYQKFANICGELEYDEIKDTRLLKQLCGGDTIQADRKFRSPIYFKNHAKLIFLTNEVPMSRDTTEAFYRRLFLIEFPKKFKENPRLEVELANADNVEYEALLYVTIKQLEKLMENNFIFTHHKNVDETRELYLKLSSPLQTFIEENCEITRMQNDYIFKFEFKEKFAQWLQNKGRTAYTAERINSEMERLGFESGQKGENKWRSWVGLTWKSAQ